ncbi:MAG: hypothetical protein JW793_04650 [Acidobacteria bacterium]|nr:hypothetical protein [Acidobacteriota bacterium]
MRQGNFALLQLPVKMLDDPVRLEFLPGQWLSYYGPMSPERLWELFGLSSVRYGEVMEALIESEQIVLDTLSERATAPQICDVANLYILLGWLRRRQFKSRRGTPGHSARYPFATASSTRVRM